MSFLHLPWGREARRRALLAEPFPPEWLEVLEAEVPHYRCLDETEAARLRDDLRVFIAEKDWESASGLELNDEIKVAVAGQACLLLLGFDEDRPERHGLFPNVRSVIIYPKGFDAPQRRRREGYIETEGDAHLLGEAWSSDLPVVLSWRSVEQGGANPEDGQNVVLHEFAHKLDMVDGSADGVPRLSRRAHYEPWAEAMSEAFESLRSQSAHGRSGLLDSYGATNEAEFFAVATEVFFERPLKLQQEMPDLYSVLCRYYQQDTAARLAACPEPETTDDAPPLAEDES